MVTIKEVSSRKEEKLFIQFQNKLYKDCEYYCPTLDSDEKATFSDKNPVMEFSEFVRFLAYKDGKLVGRIAGMINYKANEHWKNHHVRFGWFDFIDDMEVSHALLDAVVAWGKKKGMTELNGPVGFTDFDKEGLIIEGYEYLAPMAVLYNHPYYVQHIEAYGLTKETDWFEYQVFVDQVFTNIDRGSVTPVFVGTPFREGYEFVGWYPEVYETVNENITYVAKWKTNSIEQLEITDTEQKVTSEIKLESLDYTKEESRRYKVVVNQEGNNVLYFNYNITSDKNSLRNAVIAKVVSDEDGKVIYEGLLKDMPKLISIKLSGKQGEEKYYTVTLTLDQNAGGDYSQSTLDLVLSWWIDPEECICQFCLVCYLANKWFGHCCLFPFCYVSYAVLLGGGIFTVVMIAKAKKKKKKELEEAKKAQEYYQNIEQIVNDYMNNKEYNQMIEQIINDYMNNNNKKE